MSSHYYSILHENFGDMLTSEFLSDQKNSLLMTDSAILIIPRYFVTRENYHLNFKEEIIDLFSVNYSGQNIFIYVDDGDPVEVGRFIPFIEDLCYTFNIKKETVTWFSHDPDFYQCGFKHVLLPLNIFLSANTYLPIEFNRDLSNSKFVGLSIGRFSATRLRLAYEIDQHFPGDNFCIFQKPEVGSRHLQMFSKWYTNELAWLANRKFDLSSADISPSSVGGVTWTDSYKFYGDIWNRYKIEIVAETDPLADYWFTEKTGRCLAAGKPFLLVSGTGSLSNLHKMGFQTFDSVIDESYDTEKTPTLRIRSMIKSLKDLYYSQDCDSRLQKMYQISEKNKAIYNKIYMK